MKKLINLVPVLLLAVIVFYPILFCQIVHLPAMNPSSNAGNYGQTEGRLLYTESPNVPSMRSTPVAGPIIRQDITGG